MKDDEQQATKAAIDLTISRPMNISENIRYVRPLKSENIEILKYESMKV